MSATDERACDDLRAVLARLAASAEEQLAYLRELGAEESADELALDLSDLMALVPRLSQAGWLGRRQTDAIAALDAMLGAMSGQPSLWAASALRSDPAWTEVRGLAAAALHASASDQPASTTR